MPKHTVNIDLKQLDRINKASFQVTQNMVPLSLAFLFLLVTLFITHFLTGEMGNSTIIIIGTVLGGYMALNIGANDVANNVAPAVGSKALTMAGALVIAAIFEAAGAIIAGGNVVSTISKGIIDQELIVDSATFILLMLAALLSAAVWLNLATLIGAPVSTTHSIVGGVMGGGIMAAGFAVVNWATMGKIAASWIISPVMGGVIAALLFKFIKIAVLSKQDKIAASKRWVPILVSVMVSAFTMYLMVKGLKKVWKPSAEFIWITGGAIFIMLPILVRPMINKATVKLENKPKGVNKLFTVPLIISAALLSFAHGSNDVANAVGPLAAIVSTSMEGEIAAKVGIPPWVMLIGAAGISFGLLLFGPKIIRVVGEKITKIDRVRAFCIALSAAITVIIASTLGLPVSSTHITVGGVFGVGLYREFSSHKRRKKLAAVSDTKVTKRKLVRRAHLRNIVAAWIITVPCTAALAAFIYFCLSLLQLQSLVS